MNTGNEKMKKISLIVAVVFMMPLLLLIWVPAYASTPVAVTAYMDYIPTIVDSRTADGNTFYNTTEVATWTGDFEGTSTEVGRVVVHSSGAWSFYARSSFQGSVNGKSGTLEMVLVGKRADENSIWAGQWNIIGGTGELANLHGQGTWEGPGFPIGGIDFSGKIHF